MDFEKLQEQVSRLEKAIPGIRKAEAPALKEFESFPEEAQAVCLAALTIAAEGGKADIAKPMQGLGSGIFEIALPFRSDAFRVIYALQLAAEIWVIHAFQKKSKEGVKNAETRN